MGRNALRRTHHPSFLPALQEQERKKVRAERSGAAGAPAANGSGATVKPVVSVEEAAKRQARAMRFVAGLPPAKEGSSGTTAEQVSLC